MDILGIIIISAFAIGYVIEGLDVLLGKYSAWAKLMVVPLAVWPNWVFGLQNFELVISSFASGFVYLAAMKLINNQITVVNRGRRGVM
jgi:hypothetical protein